MGQKGAGMKVLHVAFVLRRKEILNKSKSIRANDSQTKVRLVEVQERDCGQKRVKQLKNCSALGTGVRNVSGVPSTGL